MILWRNMISPYFLLASVREVITMGSLKTERCVICGGEVYHWKGFVTRKHKKAFGHVIVNITAGLCDEHADVTVRGKEYDPDVMGKCIPL